MSLQARLRRSRRAGRLARGIATAAACAAAASAFLAWEGGLPAGLAVLVLGAGLAGAAWLARQRPQRFHAIAVDAGGNWLLADAGGWQAFDPERIWRSPLGWMTLQGRLAASRAAWRRAGAPERAVLTLWPDSVDAAAWRGLRVAAAWTEQREQPQYVSPPARSPRLGAEA